MELDGLGATLAGGRRRARARARSTARTRAGSGPTRRCSSTRRSTLDIDHHHDNTRFGDVNLIVADASSTGEVLRDVLRRARRRADAGDRGGALHRARDRHGPLPVHEHDAEGAPARRRAGRGRRRRPPVFQGVYESVQFAKLKLLARALERAQVYEGGRLVVSYLLRERLRRGRRRRGVLGGDHRLPARGRGRRAGGADPRAAARATGPPGASACARPMDELDVSRDRPQASGGGGHRQAAGFSSDASIEEITEFIRREFARAAAGA